MLREGWATGTPLSCRPGASHWGGSVPSAPPGPPAAACGTWASHRAETGQLLGPSSGGGERCQCPTSPPVLGERGALGMRRCQRLRDEDQGWSAHGGTGQGGSEPHTLHLFPLLVARVLGLRVLLTARHSCNCPACRVAVWAGVPQPRGPAGTCTPPGALPGRRGSDGPASP